MLFLFRYRFCFVLGFVMVLAFVICSWHVPRGDHTVYSEYFDIVEIPAFRCIFSVFLHFHYFSLSEYSEYFHISNILNISPFRCSPDYSVVHLIILNISIL